MSIINSNVWVYFSQFLPWEAFVFHSVSPQNSCDGMADAKRPTHNEWIGASWCLCLTWNFRRHGFTSAKYLLMMMVLDNDEKNIAGEIVSASFVKQRQRCRTHRKVNKGEANIDDTLSFGSGFECRMYGVRAASEVWCCDGWNPTSIHPETSLRKFAIKHTNCMIWKNFNGCD